MPGTVQRAVFQGNTHTTIGLRCHPRCCSVRQWGWMVSQRPRLATVTGHERSAVCTLRHGYVAYDALFCGPVTTREHAAEGRGPPPTERLRAALSATLSASRWARTRVTTSGDAALPRLTKTLVSTALVASARADCRSRTEFASAMATASAAARAASFALSSVAFKPSRRRRFSLGRRCGALFAGPMTFSFATTGLSAARSVE
eukprot:scaffold140113_cov127-Phaeocystis_antarctica.AAC.2